MKTNTSEVLKSVENNKNRSQTGHRTGHTPGETPGAIPFPIQKIGQDEAEDKLAARAGKDSQAYWKTRVKQRVIRGKPTPEFYGRFFEGDAEQWVCLNTSNRGSAATAARDLYLQIKAKGLAVAVAEFRPKAAPKAARSATVGELLTEAKAVSTVRASTLAQYEVSLRRLVAGLLGMNPVGSVFYHKSPEAKAWRDRVEGASLGILSDLRVEAWRKAYVADCTDERARISKRNTAAAVIRNARAFFAPSFAKAIGDKIRLPSPLPLVTLPIGSSTRRFKTSADPRKLYAEALKDLTGDSLTAFLLCITAGLRRGEADMLEWQAVNLDAALVHIAPTKWFLPKTEES
ncbi:MAG: hypothetical protein H7343_09755, partial [Undibacterium sp.]|nr:hypothetical protein [Opitutaceae bacterium]